MGFAAIHIPEFPSAAAKLKLKSISLPVIVLDGVPPQETIVSLCPKAKAAGLRHGMSKVQAEAACTGLFVKRSSAQECDAFVRLCGIADRYSPRVEAVASPKNGYSGAIEPSAVLLMDCSGMKTLFRSGKEYANLLHRDLKSKGFDGGVALAPNAEAAIMLSRNTGAVVLSSVNTVAARLAPLPVTALPCEARLKATLTRWGVRTLGQLAKLPDQALVSRLGRQGQHLQLLARGQAEHLLVPEEPVFQLREATLLDQPVELLESLLFIISPLLETAIRKAKEHAYALRAVSLVLELERSKSHSVHVQPATPTQNRDALLKLLNLELQAHPPQAGIMGVTLEAEATQPVKAQRGLFQAQFPEPDRLDLLLARLRAIVGDENVGAPRLLNTHQADAFTISPFTPAEKTIARNEASGRGLALRVLRPPHQAKVICWGEHPKVLFWKGSRRSIEFCAGPWHSSGSWWDEQAWNYELWDVVLTEPALALRLKNELGSQSWSVVGVYD